MCDVLVNVAPKVRRSGVFNADYFANPTAGVGAAGYFLNLKRKAVDVFECFHEAKIGKGNEPPNKTNIFLPI